MKSVSLFVVHFDADGNQSMFELDKAGGATDWQQWGKYNSAPIKAPSQCSTFVWFVIDDTNVRGVAFGVCRHSLKRDFH